MNESGTKLIFHFFFLRFGPCKLLCCCCLCIGDIFQQQQKEIKIAKAIFERYLKYWKTFMTFFSKKIKFFFLNQCSEACLSWFEIFFLVHHYHIPNDRCRYQFWNYFFFSLSKSKRDKNQIKFFFFFLFSLFVMMIII